MCPIVTIADSYLSELWFVIFIDVRSMIAGTSWHNIISDNLTFLKLVVVIYF